MLEFRNSQALTVGVQLELQLVNTNDFNLAPDADDLLRRAAADVHGGELKPEITEHDRDQLGRSPALRHAAGRVAHDARSARLPRASDERGDRRRRDAPFPEMEGPQDLSDRTFSLRF